MCPSRRQSVSGKLAMLSAAGVAALAVGAGSASAYSGSITNVVQTGTTAAGTKVSATFTLDHNTCGSDSTCLWGSRAFAFAPEATCPAVDPGDGSGGFDKPVWSDPSAPRQDVGVFNINANLELPTGFSQICLYMDTAESSAASLKGWLVASSKSSSGTPTPPPPPVATVPNPPSEASKKQVKSRARIAVVREHQKRKYGYADLKYVKAADCSFSPKATLTICKVKSKYRSKRGNKRWIGVQWEVVSKAKAKIEGGVNVVNYDVIKTDKIKWWYIS